uniref:Prolyl 4-hydroxylase alpha subunit domain-containing protein n=1 Tax=Octactis speculum TaxID=3111310 RepID=A0A7S2CNI7_9STRA
MPTCLSNLCEGVAGTKEKKVLSWDDFLLAEELDYFRRLVYEANPEDFGTHYVQRNEPNEVSDEESIKTDGSEEEDDENDTDDDEDPPALSAEMVAMLASMGLAPPPANGSSKASKPTQITKNRLRTSSFLRTAWFGTGQGLKIFQQIRERAANMLGLDPTCAEAPQIVCYPGGATYFRPHHDSGRLNEKFDAVELGRDEHGAARITTVFIYLSSHDASSGGATHFGHLQSGQQRDDTAEEEQEAAEYQGIRVSPKAGSAAVWSNVDINGVPDVAMVHEAEQLNSQAFVTMEKALSDQSLPLKMGLNLWFTDRRDYPRPEVHLSMSCAETILYAAQDVHLDV